MREAQSLSTERIESKEKAILEWGPGIFEDMSLSLKRKDLMIVNMGPQHPSMHGVLRLIVTLDGEDRNGRELFLLICIFLPVIGIGIYPDLVLSLSVDRVEVLLSNYYTK
ncbi:hypothetical protein ACJX0J_007155 [Zea mays]